MRLTLPPLEIDENEGFSDEKDIFKREQFGERLSNLIGYCFRCPLGGRKKHIYKDVAWAFKEKR